MPCCCEKRHDVLTSQQGLSTLSHYGFEEENQDVYREALRCIANGLLLVPALRQIFVDLGNASKATNLLAVSELVFLDSCVWAILTSGFFFFRLLMQKLSSDDEFLASRLVFFTTYGTTIDLNDLIDKHELASNVNKVCGMFHICRPKIWL